MFIDIIYNKMEEIYKKVSRNVLISELTEEKLLRKTNYGNNEIYVVDAFDSPNTMNEIGRLREIAFRAAGGGTGKSIDIDAFDIREKSPYKQLIVWDPEGFEILGGYRFLHLGRVLDSINEIDVATTELFDISDEFIKDYAPYTIELGRSFVQPMYQATAGSGKSKYILDNLWDGLGALTTTCENIKYFFGKITMYTHFHTRARDLILYFFTKYFSDEKGLAVPKKGVDILTPYGELSNVFVGENYQKDYKILSVKVRELGENIPPLFNAYMKLSPTMKVFGTAINEHFGGVEETGILITIDDIYESKKQRHIE